MAHDRLDQIVLDARRNAEKRAQGYREQALKLFPWVCGRCARTFTHSNLQLLEVHHKEQQSRRQPVGRQQLGAALHLLPRKRALQAEGSGRAQRHRKRFTHVDP